MKNTEKEKQESRFGGRKEAKMKAFGKIISHKTEGKKILFQFENGCGRLEVLTDKIINVFSGFDCDYHRSRAIEGDKAVPTEISVSTEGESVVVKTASLTAKVFDNFYVDFYDEKNQVLCRDYRGERCIRGKITEEMRVLAASEGHSLDEGAKEKKIQVVKQMEGDECFYGLGDKTGFLNKRGYEYEMWNTDEPAPQVDSFKSLYKSIPFFVTLRKNVVYGLFFDNSYRSVFDMGKESDDYFWFGCEEGNLDYYFIAGEDMPQVLGGYTYLTGTVPLPQMWTLGYQQSRWGYVTEEDIMEVAENMRRNQIPCDVIHLDIDYMERYKVFTWNKERYQDQKKTIRDLKEDGFKIVTIIDPGVKVEEGYDIYDTGVKEGYFATTPEGEIYVNAVWPGDAVYPDFGKEEVRKWWGDNQKFLLEQGVSGVWNDMNEPASFRGELPADVVFTDEDEISNHARMHNLYGHNMAKATYEGLKKHDGKRPFVITRACFAGTQKYSTAWTGDNHSIWAHLQMAIPQLCNLGMSGMSFVGTDVGGFGSDTTKELLIRWVQTGCFSPLFRNHSAIGTRRQEPWTFDKETMDIYRKYVKLRYQLIPYYYDLFFEGETSGLPIMRPLVLHYEKDENVKNNNNEFLVGENLLVAPVTEQGVTCRTVYLPAGEWYDYWTGEKIEGESYILAKAPLDTCLMYVKAGSIIPNFPEQEFVGEKEIDTLILDVYAGQGSYEHYQDNGTDFAYRQGEYNQYHIEQKENVLKISLAHKGYEKIYKKVLVKFAGKQWEADFADGMEMILK